MKSSLLLAAGAATAVLLAQAPAWADRFDFSYSGPGVTGSGFVLANSVGGGAYAVNFISGTRNGVAITGLTHYAFEDNLVYWPAAPHLDFPGLAFLTAGGDAFNVYFDSSDVGAYNCGRAGYCEVGPGVAGTDGLGPPADPTTPIEFSLASVPEPGTWALMLLGFAGVAATLRGRRPVTV